jgi:hypothetical protein
MQKEFINFKVILSLFALLGLAGTAFSASAKDKVDPFLAAEHHEIRFREALSYPVHLDKREIEVGIERINKDDMEYLLGGSTSNFRAYNVAVTNNSQFRIYINRMVILKKGTKKSFPKMDLTMVVRAINPSGPKNRGHMRMAALRNTILAKALPHTVMAPGETIQGIVLVKSSFVKDRAEFYLQIENLKRVAYLDFTLPLN